MLRKLFFPSIKSNYNNIFNKYFKHIGKKSNYPIKIDGNNDKTLLLNNKNLEKRVSSLITRYSLGSGIISGLVSQFMFVDNIALTLFSGMMIKKMAKLYGIEWTKKLSNFKTGALATANVASLASNWMQLIPGVGNFANGTLNYFITSGLGKLFRSVLPNIEHLNLDKKEIEKFFKIEIEKSKKNLSQRMKRLKNPIKNKNRQKSLKISRGVGKATNSNL